jgi:GT2 family glycosyltransferase
MITEPSVVASVVSYNRRELLLRCLESILRQSHSVSHVMVIDNASTDGTVDAVRERFPSVELVCLPTNVGGAGAFQEAIARGLAHGADWMWLMDDDCAPDPTALERLLEAGRSAEAQGPVGALASCKYGVDGEVQANHAGWYDFVRSDVSPVAANARDAFDVDIGSFVSLLVAREAAERAGPPDSAFFISLDDVDFCLRIRQSGFRIVYVPASRVLHLSQAGAANGSTRAMRLYWRQYYAMRNALVISGRHAPSRVVRAVSIVGTLITAARRLLGILIRDRDARAARMRIIWWGVSDGLAQRLGKRVLPGTGERIDIAQ